MNTEKATAGARIRLEVPASLLGRIDQAAGRGNRKAWMLNAARLALTLHPEPTAAASDPQITIDRRGRVRFRSAAITAFGMARYQAARLGFDRAAGRLIIDLLPASRAGQGSAITWGRDRGVQAEIWAAAFMDESGIDYSESRTLYARREGGYIVVDIPSHMVGPVRSATGQKRRG